MRTDSRSVNRGVQRYSKGTFDEIAGLLIFWLRQPSELTPPLLGESREFRLWHCGTHPLRIELVPFEGDDIHCGFCGVKQLSHVFVVGLRVSPTDPADKTTHRIR